jgi:hypothetical protein
MKRLFLMLVLTFSTITFFANEKTEALPDFRNLTDVESINYELTLSQAKKDLFQTLWITSIPLLSTSVSFTVANIILNIIPPLHKSMLVAYVAMGVISVTTFICGLAFLIVGVCCHVYWKNKIRQITTVQDNNLQLSFVYSFGGKK